MVSRTYQLFDEQGRALPATNLPKDAVLTQALLHGAGHIWMWRRRNGRIEVLIQRRAQRMKTFGGMLDISAAGHIDADEDAVTTAVRECQEELGIPVAPQELVFAGVHRRFIPVPGTVYIENELAWVYTLELTQDFDLKLEEAEVGEAFWLPLDELRAAIADPEKYKEYVPQGQPYFAMLFECLERVTGTP